MQTRPLGNTGLSVSSIGLGASHIGGEGVDDATAERVLLAALDAGVTLIDTARGYGRSEERIGRFLAHRRDEFVLSSKCGYGVDGVADWTGPCIERGIERALGVLRTDRIDIMHLHSCPRDVLERGDVIAALTRARDGGKIRVAAYSGENDALAFAIACGAFQSVQTSVNLCDQRSLRDHLPRAGGAGLGVIAKRPLANAFWRFDDEPRGDYAHEYWRRAREMRLTAGPQGWLSLAARFAVHAPHVHTAIVGTANLAHLQAVIDAAQAGPLPDAEFQAVRSAFDRRDQNWSGQI